MEQAAKTWSGEWWKAGGGGTAWDPIVYDPDPRSRLLRNRQSRPRGTATCAVQAAATISCSPRSSPCAARTANRLALSDHARRQLGLRRHAAADAGRPHDRRNAAKGHHAGVEERILLRARSGDGSIHLGDAVRQRHLVGHADSIPKSGRPVESPTAYAGLKPVLVSPDVEGAHNWHPMAFDPTTASCTWRARTERNASTRQTPSGSTTSATETWAMIDATKDRSTPKPLSLPPPSGELIAWNPVERRSVWRVTLSGVAERRRAHDRGESRLSRSRRRTSHRVSRDGRRAAVGLRRRDGHHGAAGHVSRVDGVQYVSVMVGWGGPTATFNRAESGQDEAGIWTHADVRARRQSHADPARIRSNRASHAGDHDECVSRSDPRGAAPLPANCASCHGLDCRGRSTSRSAVLHASGARAVRGDRAGRCARDARHAAVQGSPEAAIRSRRSRPTVTLASQRAARTRRSNNGGHA